MTVAALSDNLADIFLTSDLLPAVLCKTIDHSWLAWLVCFTADKVY